MSAPAGAAVGIYVDLVDEVAVGDVIQTQTGRRYLVLGRRVQLRGKHVGRQHLRCVVVERGDLASACVHEIRWYRRARPGSAGEWLVSVAR